MMTQREVGGPEVLELVEVPQPVPAAGQVLVRVHAAGVNPADWKIRRGEVTWFGAPPFTLGLDFAGEVVELGESVADLAVGQRVFGMSFPPHGTYAEYLAVPAGQLAPIPAGIDYVPAAALPTAGLTAWQPLVRDAGVQAGQRVLVHGASGGVGHFGVQIAKARGAHVLGTASAGKHELLRELGADELIDYTTTDFAEVVRDVDVVLDTIGWDYGPRSVGTLTATGLIIDVTGTTGSAKDRDRVRELIDGTRRRFAEYSVAPTTADLAALGELASGGALRPVIAEVLPLAQVAKAHELSETNRVAGKIVLTVS